MKARALALVAVPLLIGGVAGLALHLLGESRSLEVLVPLPTAASLAGALASLAIAAALLARRSVTRAQERGARRAAADFADEHRAFLSRLDHELKNPLTAILAANASGSEDASALVDAQARRMGILITDLRKLTDLASAPLEIEDIDVEEAARDAVEAARACAPDREFELLFPVAPWPLPHVRGDADLLYSAIQNVVMNAVKYSDPGDRIEVRGHQSGGRVSVEVADTGMGVPEADQPHIWSELARGTNAADRPGTGMGLPLVKLVVERHGGEVRLDSREGIGTSVVLSFPLPRT